MEENACHQGWSYQYLYDPFCNVAMLSGATGRGALVDRKKEKHFKQVNNLIRLACFPETQKYTEDAMVPIFST